MNEEIGRILILLLIHSYPNAYTSFKNTLKTRQKGAPEHFGFYVHGRGHAVAYESRQLIYGRMDTHLKPPEATKTHWVDQAPKTPGERE